MAFVDLGKAEEIPAGGMKGFTVADKQILVVNLAGKYYAIGGKCTHRGGDLSKGELDGEIVMCPRHHSRFEVKTGKRVAGPAQLDEPSYEVKVEGGTIKVNA